MKIKEKKIPSFQRKRKNSNTSTKSLGSSRSKTTGSKKNLSSCPYENKKAMVELWHEHISVFRQTQLLSISRNFLYHIPKRNEQEEQLMEEIDKIYLEKPFYGARRIVKELELLWYSTSRYKVSQLMKIMWIEAIYPKKKTSIPNKEHGVYPYLLRNKKIIKVNEVRSTDITYIKLQRWRIYLIAVIDWYSRKIISWKLSNTMDINFCKEALQASLEKHKPHIFNTDQWSQFTSTQFTSILENQGIQVSMDGVWRCLDNIYIERFWRSLKYEDIYIKKYENMLDAHKWIADYMEFYNTKRIHQSLDYRTPEQVWQEWIQKQNESR